MLSYRFYIRNNQDITPVYIEVDEPIGWDGCAFTLQRSDQFDGLENVYSDDLTFYGKAKDILFDAFYTYGFDALLDFKIEFYCDGVLNTTIENAINMLTYHSVGNETTVKMEESSFDRKFKSRYETQVNFNDELSIEGNTLTPLEAVNLHLHSKLIETTSIMKELGDEIDTNLNGHVPLFYSTTSDVDGINDVTSSNFDDLADNYILINNTIFNRVLKIHFNFRLNSLAQVTTNDTGNPTFRYAGGYEIYGQVVDPSGALQGSQTIASIPFVNSTVGLTNEFSNDITIFIRPGERFRVIYLDIHEATLPGDPIHRDNKYLYLPETQINFKEDSKIIPSDSSAYLLYESWNRVCEAITDQQNSFRSDFFGRINSSPQIYDANGCAAWIALTNGLNIRKMLDKNGNPFPFSTSFNDLFRSFNAIYNLGARVESDGMGGFYIRVEPKEYFYNNSEEIFTINSPADIITEVAIDKLYNDIQIGYEKWEVDNINGIDEFNTTHTYTLPLINVKQRLETGTGNGAVSPFIAGGYAIEMTRRIQYSSNPTTDSQYDNDNFIICLNQNEVTSNQYSNPPVSQSYGPGQVSERNENYISVSNLISPSTAYNLRISPANMMLNWFKSVAPALILKTNKVVKFQSGEGNYQMVTERIDSCSIASGSITEDQDLTVETTRFSDIKLIALYTPVYISFDYPIDFGNFITIKEGSNKLIRVQCEDLVYFGFIKELKFTPNDGSATFKMLLAGCTQGGFDSGFSRGFEIGTC